VPEGVVGTLLFRLDDFAAAGSADGLATVWG
jgi:hypothetical protein